jgi:hypothetical protein
LGIHQSVKDLFAKRFGKQVIDITARHVILRWLGTLVPVQPVFSAKTAAARS